MYRRTLRPDTCHKEHEALTTSMGCQAVQRPPSVQRIVLGVLICVLVLCCAPPLRVIRDGQSVIIDVQTLGVYGTSISRIRLTDATTKTVVWELASKSGEPRIWTVKVQPGSNETRVDAEAGTFQVLIPNTAESFVLVAGRSYVIEVWGLNGRRSSRTFEL